MKNILTPSEIRMLSFTVLAVLFTVSPSWADPIVKKDRSVGSFSGIKVGGAFNVILNQGSSHKVVVEAEEDLHEKIRTEVKGDVLHIEMENSLKWHDDHDEITIYIDVVKLEMLDVSGAADVNSNGTLQADNLELEVSGAGDVTLEVNVKSIDVTVNGAGDLRISGSTDRQQVRLSGAGDYQASGLKSNYTNARASGAGNITVHASQEIEAYASGAGTVKFYGNPSKEKTSSSGAGTIRKAN